MSARASAGGTGLLALTGAAMALALAPPPALADGCADAGVRAAQGGTRLPECRAYEMVTPADKNGDAIRYATMSDPPGGGITFKSTGAFGGSPSSVGADCCARRGDAGWVSTSCNFATSGRLPAPPMTASGS
jgi:hypothetical protein